MVKTLKNLLLWNQKAEDLETWYAASGAGVLPSMFKCRIWVDLDLFYGKVKFGPLCFCMGKKVKQWIFQKLFKSLISKLVDLCSQLNYYMKIYEYQQSRSFTDLCPTSLRFNIFKLLFFKNNTRPIEAIFQVETSWDGRMKASIKWFMSHDQDGHRAHIC